MSAPQSTTQHVSPVNPVAAPAVDQEVPFEDTVTAPDGSTILANEPEIDVESASMPEMSKEDLAKAKGEVYTATSTWLREKYRPEFNAEMKRALAERGIEWTPAPTKEERAKAAARKALLDAGLEVPESLQ